MKKTAFKDKWGEETSAVGFIPFPSTFTVPFPENDPVPFV